MKRTAMQEFIKWGDKMMKDHPMKELGFGEAIDKAVALLELERQQIVQSYNKGAMSPERLGSDFYTETYSIDHNELYLEMVVKSEKPINFEITENTSDGYHTFKELYEFRKAYNVALFNQWGKYRISKPEDKMEMYMYDVHKSWKHHDGELCFGGGWFIVVAYLPEGQISNHYEAKDWDLFKIPERETATYPFDGHTGQDVIHRLLNLY